MKNIKSLLSLVFAKKRYLKSVFWKKNAVSVQKSILKDLVRESEKTQFGRDHGFSKITNYSEWRQRVPIREYEDFATYIEKIKSGERNVLWPGKPLYLSETSGTTSGKKYIPITKASMPNHINAAKDAILMYIWETKNTSIVSGKMIFLQGSPKLTKVGGILTGRLSGIVAHHIPFYLKRNRLPSFKTNCIEDWDTKVNTIVEETMQEKMTIIGGIPPWVQMYFEKINKKTGENINSTFPFFGLFVYGGVNFDPYKKTFDSLIGKKIDSVELYPASEGFIAYQDSQKEEGMLLCVNHGIFYEFIPSEEFFNKIQKRISLEEVHLGVNYVLILNTNAGLFGYNLGDIVKFVSIDPYKIIITGRIKHFTSAFGEHVIAEEVEKSVMKSLLDFNIEINEFHVAPEVNPSSGLPFHEWFIEFNSFPKDMDCFAKSIDDYLQELNPYYKDLIVGNVLTRLKIVSVSSGGFRSYMRSVGKLGSQNKAPRLSNDRKIADQLKKYEINEN